MRKWWRVRVEEGAGEGEGWKVGWAVEGEGCRDGDLEAVGECSVGGKMQV